MLLKQGTLNIEEEKKSDEAWGKLLSLNEGKHPSIELKQQIITIGRSAANFISIPDKSHCSISKEGTDYFIEDLSTNGTFLNNTKIGKGNKLRINNGDKFHLLHQTKVQESDIIGYTFNVVGGPNLRRKNSDKSLNLADILQKQQKMDDDLGEEMKCLICLDYIYQAVTLIDCLHNVPILNQYIQYCFQSFVEHAIPNEWRNQIIVLFAKKKLFLQKRMLLLIIQSMLIQMQLLFILIQQKKKHPDKKRDKKEYDEMEKKNKITIESQTLKELKGGPNTKQKKANKKASINQPQPQQQLQQQRNRRSQPLPQQICQECSVPRADDGFQCAAGQVHYICENCMKQFPDRGDPKFKQECLICNSGFCNLYWKCTGRRANKLLELKHHKIPANLDDNIFRSNKFELNTFKKFLAEKKYSLKYVYEFMLKNVLDKGEFKYKVDKSLFANFNQQSKIEITMKSDSPVCLNCFPQVWFQIIFRYRIKIKDQLPDPIKKRGNCWYGINCTTMSHNEDHAKKLDHICEQAKFK